MPKPIVHTEAIKYKTRIDSSPLTHNASPRPIPTSKYKILTMPDEKNEMTDCVFCFREFEKYASFRIDMAMNNVNDRMIPRNNCTARSDHFT